MAWSVVLLALGCLGKRGGEVGMEVERRMRWEWRGAGKTVALQQRARIKGAGWGGVPSHLQFGCGCVGVCVRLWESVCVRACTNACMHMHTHTHKHTHAHANAEG